MKCPYCGDEASKVIDSRPTEDGERIRRRRECLRCHMRCPPDEVVETVPLIVINKDNSREPFDRPKGLNAMLRAGAGISVVNPLTALDYADSGVVVRRFSVEVPFTVSLIRPLHRPRSALVDAFVTHLQQSLPQILTPLASILQRA